MNGHVWEPAENLGAWYRASSYFPNSWRCSRCGALSGISRSLPSVHSAVNRDGYIGRAFGGVMTCDEYLALRVLSS